LELESMSKRDGKSLEFKRSENVRLREMYLKTTGSQWGE